MLWFKFSLILIIANFAFAQSFNSKQCLDSKFSNHIENGGQIFGLIKNDLKITKDGCQLKIQFKKILESTWNIDLCRKPIHMKMSSKGSQQVYKRGEGCSSSSDSEYCQYKDELLGIIQDYGLIYAKGERERLDTDHGQTYCTFLLLKKYLNDGILFSNYEAPIDIFEKQIGAKDESCPIPERSNNNFNSYQNGTLVTPTPEGDFGDTHDIEGKLESKPQEVKPQEAEPQPEAEF